MNLKTISSAYFIPIKIDSSPSSHTLWLNLARVAEIRDDGQKLRILDAKERVYLLEGESRNQLLEELQFLRAKQISI